MNAFGDKQKVQSIIESASHIRWHTIANCKDPSLVDVVHKRTGSFKSSFIDRRMWLSSNPGLAAKLFIKSCKRSGTGDQAIATGDHEVGIGTDQRGTAVLKPDKHVAVIFRRLGLIVKETGAQNAFGFRFRHLRLRGLPEVGRATRSGLDAVITLVPVDLVKGLELDAALVVEPAAIVGSGDRGLQALYVALTRATRRLTVVHARPLPDALRE